MISTDQTATRIAAIYTALASFPLDWVQLTHIRAELADLTREEQDEALMYLLMGNTVAVDGATLEGHLAPDSSRARNQPESIAAAFRNYNLSAFQAAG